MMDYGNTAGNPNDFGGAGTGAGMGFDNLMQMLVPGVENWRSRFGGDPSAGLDANRLLGQRPNAAQWLEKLMGKRQAEVTQLQQAYDQQMAGLQNQANQIATTQPVGQPMVQQQQPVQAAPVQQPAATSAYTGPNQAMYQMGLNMRKWMPSGGLFSTGG